MGDNSFIPVSGCLSITKYHAPAEGGKDTGQPEPRIVNIQPGGEAFETAGLRVGQVITSVNGIQLRGEMQRIYRYLEVERIYRYLVRSRYDIEISS